ncbi:MAG TPA: hypothetical protein VGB15_14985 [Longimicrobium sp.]
MPNETFPDRLLNLEFGGSRITLSDLVAASARVLGILTDVDARTSNEPGGSLDWVIRDLRPGSAVLEVYAEPKGKQTDPWVPSEVVRRFKSGIRHVVERGERPPYFSERAMQQAFELVTILNENGINAFRVGHNGEKVEITPALRKPVKEALEGSYKAIGSVEGRIEGLSAHEPPYSCTVYTLVTGEAIRCNFADPELLTTAYKHFRQRVTLRGVLTSRPNGEVTSMRVYSIDPFPADDDLPTVDDILGILANGA